MKTCTALVQSLSLSTLLCLQNVLKNAKFDILVLLKNAKFDILVLLYTFLNSP